ncbi:MAG: hypothetical protein CVU74_05295 [Deltaproteobacteria bacterium HGW-Deltaproteobacteria-9]|nr:MAG: hypothetical protein CVU74_05295 [Deltaproteobacteria bacterium HGW-Deltaproteobacteria-9]
MSERRSKRTFVSYMDKSREYYAAQGYTQPYTWAHHTDVPFSTLRKPLSECRIGLITTASNVDVGKDVEGLMRNRDPFALSVDPAPARLFTAHLFWDKDATHTDDLESFLPVKQLSELAKTGRIQSASPRFYGVPTEYSQGRTRLKDAPKILEYVREDGVDAVILTAL